MWEWLLIEANRLGISGGSAFPTLAGFGRHHRLHEAKFFELAGTLTVLVEFFVTDEQARLMLERVRAESLRLVYARLPAFFGVIDPGAEPGHPTD